MSAPITAAARALHHKHPYLGWRGELAALVHSYAGHKADGRVLSSRTRAEIFQVLFMQFELLKTAGFRFRPRNLSAHHIEWLRQHYAVRLCDGSITTSTLHTYWSVLRRFADETGHRGLVAPLAQLFSGEDTRRVTAARTDKSWSGHGIDTEAVIERAWAAEPFVAMALLAQAALGLRRREALCLRPHHVDLSAGVAEIRQGAKGGRQRVVPIEKNCARAIFETLRAWVQARDGRCGGSIGPQDAHHTLAGNLKRYAHILGSLGMTRADAGVTGHGLRAQWAIEFLERRGHELSVRAGGQAVHEPLSPEQRLRQQDDRAVLARRLGHARVSVVDAYAGSLPDARARRAANGPDT